MGRGRKGMREAVEVREVIVSLTLAEMDPHDRHG